MTPRVHYSGFPRGDEEYDAGSDDTQFDVLSTPESDRSIPTSPITYSGEGKKRVLKEITSSINVPSEVHTGSPKAKKSRNLAVNESFKNEGILAFFRQRDGKLGKSRLEGEIDNAAHMDPLLDRRITPNSILRSNMSHMMGGLSYHQSSCAWFSRNYKKLPANGDFPLSKSSDPIGDRPDISASVGAESAALFLLRDSPYQFSLNHIDSVDFSVATLGRSGRMTSPIRQLESYLCSDAIYVLHKNGTLSTRRLTRFTQPYIENDMFPSLSDFDENQRITRFALNWYDTNLMGIHCWDGRLMVGDIRSTQGLKGFSRVAGFKKRRFKKSDNICKRTPQMLWTGPNTIALSDRGESSVYVWDIRFLQERLGLYPDKVRSTKSVSFDDVLERKPSGNSGIISLAQDDYSTVWALDKAGSIHGFNIETMGRGPIFGTINLPRFNQFGEPIIYRDAIAKATSNNLAVATGPLVFNVPFPRSPLHIDHLNSVLSSWPRMEENRLVYDISAGKSADIGLDFEGGPSNPQQPKVKGLIYNDDQDKMFIATTLSNDEYIRAF